MPIVDNFGISVGIQVASNPEGRTGSTTFTPVPESKPAAIWQPVGGMLSPVYVSSIETPAKILANYDLPMKIVMDFKDPTELLDYMKGDMRVELLVDGIPSGLRHFREFKIKGKGFHVEFGGFRVGRTDERAFVFTPLPKLVIAATGRQGNFEGSRVEAPKEIENQGLAWIEKALVSGNTDPIQMTGEQYPHEGLYPPAPVGIPLGVSVIQLLVSVGRKYRTLEKYLMGPGATQTTAFYYAPKPPVALTLDPTRWQAPVSLHTSRRGATSTSEKRVSEGGNGGVARLTVSGGQEQAKKNGDRGIQNVMPNSELILDTASKEGTWRPVGLARNVTKTAQTKEVQFAARLHLVRFCFFVVPPQGLTLPTVGGSRPTMVIILKLSNLKKLTKLPLSPAKSPDGTANGMEDSNADSDPMDSRIMALDNTFTTLRTLAEAAAVVEASSPTSSELTPLDSPEPQANEMEDSSPPKSTRVGHMFSGASNAAGPGKVKGKRKATGLRRPVGRPPKKPRIILKKEI